MEISASTKEKFNAIKQQFALFKNGVVADTLASMKLPHRLVWGVDLPRLKEIAGAFEPDEELAKFLWQDTDTRESVLIAPMLMPADAVTLEKAMRMVEEAPTVEAVDILVHSLLRKLPFAGELMERLAGAESSMERYASMRLLAGRIAEDADRAERMARAEFERSDLLTRIPAYNILQDIEFFR